LFESIKDTVATGLTNAIEGLIDGTKSLSESLSGVLKQIGSIVLQAGTQSVIGSLFPSAKGNVFSQNKIVPFAYGGIVDKPTLFPMANGAGLMGEAGPEAIMPLRRGADGRLGVEASGSGMGGIVVNVDATGSTVEGDAQQSKALGNAIGAAVQAEIIKQKMPGGLLN
jgi:lambda family phage tail tape measure protein